MGQVVSQDELILRRGEWKRRGEGVVCVFGVFDLLHPGHIRLLEQARSAGDVVVVAIESDARARKDLGERLRSHRPSDDRKLSDFVTPANERAEILAALAAVDCVVEIDEPATAFLSRLEPDAVVTGGSDHSELKDQEIATGATKRWRVIRVPLEPGYSTTRLRERIADLRA